MYLFAVAKLCEEIPGHHAKVQSFLQSLACAKDGFCYVGLPGALPLPLDTPRLLGRAIQICSGS